MLNSCANGVCGREHRQRLRRRLRRQPDQSSVELAIPTPELPEWFLGARLGVGAWELGVDACTLRSSSKTLQAESHPCMRAPCGPSSSIASCRVVAGLAVTPTGQDRLAELHPLTDAGARRRGAAGHDRRHAASWPTTRVSAAGAVGSRRDPRRARRRGPRARSAAPAWPGRLSRVDRAVAQRDHEASAPRFRSCSALVDARRVVQAARSPTSAARSSRRARSPTTPARRSRSIRDRLRRQKQRAADDARLVPARPRDGEVPAGAGRHRSQRPLRADGSRRASRARSRASCTAPRPAARACSSSRSRPSRSTTTSSRSKSRRPKRSAASCSR